MSDRITFTLEVSLNCADIEEASVLGEVLLQGAVNQVNSDRAPTGNAYRYEYAVNKSRRGLTIKPQNKKSDHQRAPVDPAGVA
jgi:hypothetical protein